MIQEITQAEKFKEIILYAVKIGYNLKNTNLANDNVWKKICENSAEVFVFDHSFLKALFGEEMYINYILGVKFQMQLWKIKAHELVELPEEKRIDYLYNYIKEQK